MNFTTALQKLEVADEKALILWNKKWSYLDNSPVFFFFSAVHTIQEDHAETAFVHMRHA